MQQISSGKKVRFHCIMQLLPHTFVPHTILSDLCIIRNRVLCCCNKTDYQLKLDQVDIRGVLIQKIVNIYLYVYPLVMRSRF